MTDLMDEIGGDKGSGYYCNNGGELCPGKPALCLQCRVDLWASLPDGVKLVLVHEFIKELEKKYTGDKK